jgi:hypothetical protein
MAHFRSNSIRNNPFGKLRGHNNQQRVASNYDSSIMGYFQQHIGVVLQYSRLGAAGGGVERRRFGGCESTLLLSYKYPPMTTSFG